MTDNDILQFFLVNGRINSNKIRKIKSKDYTYSEIRKYLDNRFSDYSHSYTEIINRIRFHIEVAPVCKCCGAPVQWISKNKYRDFCSCSCKNKYMFNEIKEKSIINHGSVFNRNKFKDTILKKFGKENWCNREKFKETFSEKSKEEIDKINKKKGQTKLERYNDENYNNRELSAYVTFLHYGVDNYFKTDECKIKSKNSYLRNKEEINIKSKQTRLSKYNSYNNYEKVKHTKLIKYGDENYNNRSKAKQTCVEKYGVENIFNLEFYKEKAHSIESLEKINNTKRKNNTFNTSKTENESYILLKEKYSDVIYQYKDKDRYPFACDFYIPSLDLFIECNYHWTHGGKPYEGTDEDKSKVNIWKEKKTKYYENAIHNWTVRDVNKRKVAKKNNLNYIEFFDIEDLKKFINIE